MVFGINTVYFLEQLSIDTCNGDTYCFPWGKELIFKSAVVYMSFMLQRSKALFIVHHFMKSVVSVLCHFALFVPIVGVDIRAN
jgi:hypothetical protein